MKRHVTCFVEKAGFEPRTLGTKAESYDNCATRPVGDDYDVMLHCTIGHMRRVDGALQAFNALVKICSNMPNMQFGIL